METIVRLFIAFLPTAAIGYVVFRRGWENSDSILIWTLIVGIALFVAFVSWLLFDWIRDRISPKEAWEPGSRDDRSPNLPLGVAVLVHGTWGRGALFVQDFKPSGNFTDMIDAPWFHTRSSFSDSLRRQLPEQMKWDVQAFNWSGANSVKVRYQAAKALAVMLREQLDRAEFCVVIAHSHGGNIALMAIRMLGEASDRVHLVTLATPFLSAFAEIKDENAQYYTLPVFTFIAIAALVGCVNTPMIADALVYLDRTHQSYYVLLGLPLMGGLVYLIARLVIGVFFNVNLSWFPWSSYPDKSRKISWQERPFVLEAMIEGCDYAAGNIFETRKLPPQNNPARILVLRGYDDEAALTLAAGAIATRLSSVLHVLLIGALPVVIGLALTLREVPDLFGSNPNTLFFVYFGMVGLITGVMLLPNIARTVFGREFLFGAAPCTVNTNTAPDSAVSIIRTLKPRGSLFSRNPLRHSLYDNSDCVTEIALWISSEVKRIVNAKASPGGVALAPSMVESVRGCRNPDQ